MITIKSEKDNAIFSFPQSIDEVSAESLVELTKHFTLGKGKILLCLVGSYNLFAVRTAIKGAKDVNASVTPIVAKMNSDVEKDFGFKVGDVAVIAPSDVERGIHAMVSCGASYSNLQRLISTDKEFSSAIINNEVIDDKNNSIKDICAISFKIVNAYDIAATVSKGSKEDAYTEIL